MAKTIPFYKTLGQDLLMSLELQSFQNLVSFYSDELRQIQNGAKPLTSFSAAQRGRLRELGILTHDPYRLNRLRPSSKALEVLEGRNT